MTKLAAIKRKLAGKTRELVAETVGDGKLQEEGRREARDAEAKTNEPSRLNPLRNLNDLT